MKVHKKGGYVMWQTKFIVTMVILYTKLIGLGGDALKYVKQHWSQTCRFYTPWETPGAFKLQDRLEPILCVETNLLLPVQNNLSYMVLFPPSGYSRYICILHFVLQSCISDPLSKRLKKRTTRQEGQGNYIQKYTHIHV